MSDNTPADWQHYWDTAVPTSIAGGFENGYDGEIFEFWQTALTGKSGHVVDLACGNGALTWVVDKILNSVSPSAQITGIDYANITPFETLKKNPADFPNMSFIGGTSIDTLPFEDSSIDSIVSQWGIEYSDLEKSIPELSRVLQKRSQLAFICHHDGTDILKRSRQLYNKYQVIFERPGIFQKLFELDALYNSKTNIKQVYSDALYIPLIGGINEDMTFYNNAFTQQNDDTVNDIQKFLTSLMNLFSNTAYVRNTNRKANIQKNKDMLYLSAARMEDLFQAALSEHELQAMYALLEKEGFTIDKKEPLIQTNMGDIGRIITAHRV